MSDEHWPKNTHVHANVFDRSHNLIGMLLTYVLQDNKLQVGQWVASTQSIQPPSPTLPHTDLFFSPRPRLASFDPRFPFSPQPSWEPVRRLSLKNLMGVTNSNSIWI